MPEAAAAIESAEKTPQEQIAHLADIPVEIEVIFEIKD